MTRKNLRSECVTWGAGAFIDLLMKMLGLI